MPNNTTSLEIAKRNKKDEFYTESRTIEEEMEYYSLSSFSGKVVYCNCDNPFHSKFVDYFIRNFHRLELKELIATSLKHNNNSIPEDRAAWCLHYSGELTTGNLYDISSFVTPLTGNGDFRSEECMSLLQKADIIVTNPPFSLLREYIGILNKYHKEFLILANIGAVTYKECFQMFLDGRLWLGGSIHSGDREFEVPDYYCLDMNGSRKLPNGDIWTKAGRIDTNGKKYVRVKGIRWLTNLDYETRHIPFQLDTPYIPEEYSFYDNIPMVINVNRTSCIPKDYKGIMGVPITFLDKYCPEQFRIIGNEYTLGVREGRGYVHGKRMFSRVFIQARNLR
jgi:hypothetical protein